MIGTTLSHYSIEAELGRGGMGIVYKARDTKLERDVAIKVLPATALASQDDRARFYREAKAAAALNHPHIAAIHQIDEAIPLDKHGNEINASDGLRPFIAMEFIEGRTLDAVIADGPMKLDMAVKLTRQVAEALGAAHAKQIVHRDIKAGNIMVTESGNAKVLDFGLAQTAHSTKLTRMGSTLGTVAYMSPEQARGEEVDGRSDLYSLGTVLYEMLVGKLPFGGQYEQAVVYGILNEDPEPITALRTGVPMALEVTVEKLLRKEARLRYQNAEGLIADLDALDLSGSSGSRTTMRTRLDMPIAQQAMKTTWQTTMVMVVAALLVGALGMWFLSSPEEPDQTFHITPVEGLESAKLSPDGKAMAWIKQDTLFYRPFSSTNTTELYVGDVIKWFSWSPDSRSIVLVDEARVLNVRVDGSGDYPIGELPPSERIQGIVWTPTGRVFISVQYGGANGEIFEFPASGGERKSFLEVRTSSGSFSVNDMAWLPGPGVLIGSTKDFTEDQIRVLKPETNKERALDEALIEATSTNIWMYSLAYDPKGFLIYDRGDDLWQLPINPNSGMPTGEPVVLHGGWESPSAGSNGSMMVLDFGAPFSSVRAVLFNPESGEMTQPGIELEGRIMYPVFHPDGDRVIVSTPEGAKLASLERGDAQRISTQFAVISQWVNDRVLIVSDYG
ncbi:protein kinase, partial [bacterium]|nr:protein kinase [bacterium]